MSTVTRNPGRAHRLLGPTGRISRPVAGPTVSVSTMLRRRGRDATETVEGMVPADNVITGLLDGRGAPNILRVDGHTHVSDLLGKCPRALAYSLLEQRPLVTSVTSEGLALVYSIGKAIQQHVTERLMERSADTLYSPEWSCACGGHTVDGTLQYSREYGKRCPACEGQADQYRELKLYHEGLNITGAVDLSLMVAKRLYFTEVKSMRKEDWKVLERPTPIHILQVVFYWWLATEQALPMHQQVSVLYVSKEAVRGSPYKEYSFDPRKHLNRLSPYIEEARRLKDAVAGGDLPERKCPDVLSTMAKKCTHCVRCFHDV